MRVLGFIVGVILLLPGACSLEFMVMSLWDRDVRSLAGLWLIGLPIGFGGIVMIVNAVRGPRPPRRDPPA